MGADVCNEKTYLPTLSPTPYSSSLVLYYPFNDTSGSTTAQDYSGNGYTATATKQNGKTLPSFSGATVRLIGVEEQFLQIHPSFLSVLASLEDFSVTLNAMFPKRVDGSFFAWGYKECKYSCSPCLM